MLEGLELTSNRDISSLIISPDGGLSSPIKLRSPEIKPSSTCLNCDIKIANATPILPFIKD